MNGSCSMKSFKQQITRIHLDLIIHALKTLNQATSYQIKEFTDKSARIYVDSIYRSKLLYASQEHHVISKKKFLDNCRMELRTIQLKLKDLKTEGKVNHDDKYRYYLTEDGYEQKLFGEPFGKALFEGLTEIQLKGTDEEKVLECINRLGTYLIYIFMNGTAFTWGSHTQQIIAKYDTEWINEAINGELIFKWVSSQFPFDKIPRTLKGRRYNEIMQPLYEHFPELIQKLQISEMAFNRKFFEPEFTANKKWLDSFESKK
jgi:hypothetical protein